MLFREGVIGFFIGETEEEKGKRAMGKYCETCRKAKKDINCAECSKNIVTEERR